MRRLRANGTEGARRSRRWNNVRARSSEGSVQTGVEELNERFAIEGSVRFEEGRGGLPNAVLTHEDGFEARVSLFGANVLSWAMPTGDEVLLVREDARFDRSKPISGGIPVRSTVLLSLLQGTEATKCSAVAVYLPCFPTRCAFHNSVLDP